MANILLIETATQVCSVGVCTHDGLVAIKESHDQKSHAEWITTFIQEVLTEASLPIEKLDAVAVSKGPGSYTGLRIGVSTAKGFCYALDKPLIAIDTLEALAFGMKNQLKQMEANTLFCPMIDARRMEVYAALFDRDLVPVQQTHALPVNEDSFQHLWSEHTIYFAGDGAPKCKSLFQKQPKARFIELECSVRQMVSLALKAFDQKDFENLAYFEPFYLKDFIAGIPRVKGLRE
jgi:tRNA threonylcarbamoyladenosine biosynthesis protein TsaB